MPLCEGNICVPDNGDETISTGCHCAITMSPCDGGKASERPSIDSFSADTEVEAAWHSQPSADDEAKEQPVAVVPKKLMAILGEDTSPLEAYVGHASTATVLESGRRKRVTS